MRLTVRMTVAKALVGAALLTLGLAACSNSDDSAATPDAGVLFVVDTPSSVIESSGDSYRLVIPTGEKLLWFTETPERIAGVVSLANWMQQWERNGFVADPPNAALIVDTPDGPKTHIVEMSDPIVEGDHLSFALADVEPNATGVASHAGRSRTHELQAGSMGHTELFIDSVDCTTDCTTAPATSALTGTDAAELLTKIPAGSISAGSIQLAPNITINSMSVTKQADGSFTAAGAITLGKVITVNANATFVDGSNWSITLASAGAPAVKVGSTGITLDPSTISGTISDNGGSVAWNLNGSTITWPVASAASLTTQFSLGNVCPVSTAGACPGGDNLYLGLPSGTLSLPGMPTVQLAGGVTLDGSWARLQGSANASASFSVAGASVSMGSPSLTVWRGQRGDSYDPNMVLPDTSALTNGTNFEFCGSFAIKVPGLVNQSTGGCARWTPAGIVLGQVGSGPGMTLSGGLDTTGTTADVKGIGWSNLSSGAISALKLPNDAPGAISFSGVTTPLFPSGLSLGGKAHLPGVVASAIGLPTANVDVDITGKITADSIAVQGTIPVTINFGNEPFKVSVQSLTLGVAAGGGQGFSMTLGTASDVTLGYGSTARVVHSNFTLVAATAPATGFTLSLSAVGTPGGGDTSTGLTPSTRLGHPSQATYLVPDLFGIKGVNLWSLTGQIGWTGGSPSMAVSTTSYLNPAGGSTKSVMACTGACDDTDWMIGNFGFDASFSSPCFVYSFDGNSGGGSIAIDGGVMKASVFQVGMAPNGCSVQAGSSTIALPKAFAGFAFSASFGSATVNVATQVSVDGFLFNTTISNIAVGGFNLKNMSLNVSINSSGSNVDFDALTSAPKFGTLAFSADMSIDTSGNMNWDVTADICNDSSKVHCDPGAVGGGQTSGPSAPEQARNADGTTNVTTNDVQAVGFQMVQMHFEQTGSVSTCSSLTGQASGYLKMSGSTYQLLGPNDDAVLPDGSAFPGSKFVIDCKGVKDIDFGITFTHKSAYLNGSATSTLVLGWNALTSTLQGSYSVAMTRNTHVHVTGHTYDNQQYWDINVTAIISQSSASFAMSAHVHSGRVDGYLDFYLNSSGDFVGKVRLSVDVPWSDSTYHVDWDDL